MSEQNNIPRVLIVCDDPLARVGLAALLGNRREISVAGDGSSGGDIFSLASMARADVILWDIERREHAISLAGRPVGLPVVALVPDRETALRTLDAGVAGILLRDADPGAIGAALCAAARGLFVSDPSMRGPAGFPDLGFPLAPRWEPRIEGGDETNRAGKGEVLTPRELEVLSLVAAGHPNKIIAHRLGISEHTVKFHLNSIMMKLGAQSRTDAAMRGARLGLISL